MEPTNHTPQGINLFYPLLVLLLGTSTAVAYHFFAPTTGPKGDERTLPTLITETPPPAQFPSSTPIQEIASASSSGDIALRTIGTPTETDVDTLPPPAPNNSDRLAPSTPDGLTGRLIGADKVILSWSPSTDNAGVAGYRVYRNSVAIGTTIKTIYSFIRLTPSTTYTFGIVAYDSAGNTSKMRNILITTAKKPTTTTTATTSAVTPLSTPTVETPPVQTPVPEPVASYCGNGIQDRGEECDDGNTSDNDSCTNQCRAAYCGDAIVNYQSEQCDDGNQYDNDYCTNSCQNHVPVVPETPNTTSTSPSGGNTRVTNPNPTTYTVHVTSAGVCDATSLTLQKGDSVNFIYSAPIGDEVKIRFSPTTISGITLDHERTQVSRTWSTAGTWSFSTSRSQGTIVVQ